MRLRQHIGLFASSLLGVLCGVLLTHASIASLGRTAQREDIADRVGTAQTSRVTENSVKVLSPHAPPTGVADEREDDTEPEHEAESPPLEQADLAELRVEARERWNRQLAQVAAEPVDPEFAARGEAAIARDLTSLGGEHGFELVATDCHREHCSATVSFRDVATARARFSALLHHPYQLNCATRILLDESVAEERKGPFRSTVLFDCGELRFKERLASTAR